MNVSAESIPDYYRYEDINYAIVALLRGARGSYSDSPTVLDIGCGRARLGLRLKVSASKLQGWITVRLRVRLPVSESTEVIELDITDYSRVEQTLADRRFDFLMAADSLEHSLDPYGVLKFYRKFLKPNGYLVLSLPNVVVWDNRLRTLFGRFDYADSGVMDRTHLRFFTFRSARQLVVDCGFVPEKSTFEPGIARAFLPVIKRYMGKGEQSPGSILDSKAYGFYQQYLLPIEKAVTAVAQVCWRSNGDARAIDQFLRNTTDPSKSNVKSISLRPASSIVARSRLRSFVWNSRKPAPPAPTSFPPVAAPRARASS